MVGGELVVDEDVSSMLGHEVLVPAYPEVTITVERQAGKTVVVWSWINHRALLWKSFDGRPQNIAYTAQSGADGRKKFRKDFVPMIRKSPLWRKVEKPRYSPEDTGLNYRNDSNLSIWSTSKSAGHGETLDLGVLDELFDDEDDRREQAMVPAFATRHDRQKLICSTAEDARGVILRRKRTAGRKAVEAGRRGGIAYFEWSADPKDDPESPDTWRRCHPALGYTITERTIRQALDEMRGDDGDLTEFKRAWLNIPVDPSKQSAIIDMDRWSGLTAVESKIAGPVSWALDITPERSWSSFAAAGRRVDGIVHVGVVRRDPGTGWVLAEARSLWERFRSPLRLDPASPAGSMISSLRELGVEVYEVPLREHAQACGAFVDHVENDLLRHPHQPTNLDVALLSAVKRNVSEAWAWDRRNSSADISPLVAVTLALGGVPGADQPYDTLESVW